MKSVIQFHALERVNLPAGPVHLAIGMFDGVHRGHQSVVHAAVQAAHRDAGRSGVLTFWPHPSVVIRPESPARLILDAATKRNLLSGLGVDFLIEHPFTPEFAATGAMEFVALLKRVLPGLKAVYVGENFRFGRGREGDIALLGEAAKEAGFEVVITPRLHQAGAPISSSRLRELIAAGEMEEANALLGFSYFSVGQVESGRRMGRELGFPTLNLRWEPGLAPRYGVYAVRLTGPDGRKYPGVANYGLRPTIVGDAPHPLLEVHVLEETPLTYGDVVTVQWLRFLRAEQKFSKVEELRAQIDRDRTAALAALPGLSAQDSPKSA